MDELAKHMTQLWEAGNDWRDVMPVEQAHAEVREVIGMLDRGEVRVAEVVDGDVVVTEWAKHAILMWFRVQEMAVLEAGPFEYVDKLPLKHGYEAAGVRVVPGTSARFGSYLAPGVVMMPSYVNIGAYVDSGTMVDTWATVASCAQVGKNVHLSGGVGLGGVLEPPQAKPVVIEDDCVHRFAVHDRQRCTRAHGREARRRRDPHRHDSGDRGGNRKRDRPRGHPRAGDRGAGHAYAGVRGRHLRPAVRVGAALPRRG